MSQEHDEDVAAQLSPEAFDAQFRAQHRSPLLTELWARAWGEQYPAEVRPNSGCPWRLLGLMVADLRPAPGATVADLGCGLGGPGLWLARATGTRLIGVDWSAAAVEIAAERAHHWLPAERVEFRTGSFTDTGLADGVADAVISVDALALAMDPQEALAEVRRVLRPDGTLLFTGAEPRTPDAAATVWEEPLRAAGFRLDSRTELPGEGAAWGRLYGSIRQHQGRLREQMGDRATRTLLAEADMVQPHIEQLSWGVVRARATG